MLAAQTQEAFVQAVALQNEVNVSPRDSIQVSIDRTGRVFWNGEPVADDAWAPLMREAARLDPQPELHIHADGDIAYWRVVTVMSDATRAGLTRIGFVTDPRESRSGR